LGCHRRLIRPSPSGRPPGPPRPRDTALGVVRGGQELLTPPQPRPRLLRRGESPSRRETGRHLDGPQTGPALLPHPSSRRSHRGLRHAINTRIPPAGADGQDRPQQTSRSRGCQLPQPACPPASVLDRLRTLSRPRSQPTGVTQSRMLSPTTPCSSRTQVTQGAPTPPPAGTYHVDTATPTKNSPPRLQ